MAPLCRVSWSLQKRCVLRMISEAARACLLVHTGQRPKLQITVYPTNADLFLLDGTPLQAPALSNAYKRTLVSYDLTLRGYYVRVRPPLNQYSAT